jgi:hypothetical protein
MDISSQDDLLLPLSTFGLTEKGKTSKQTRFSDNRMAETQLKRISENEQTPEFCIGQSIFEQPHIMGKTQSISNYEAVLASTFKPTRQIKIVVPEKPLPIVTSREIGSKTSMNWDKKETFLIGKQSLDRFGNTSFYGNLPADSPAPLPVVEPTVYKFRRQSCHRFTAIEAEVPTSLVTDRT